MRVSGCPHHTAKLSSCQVAIPNFPQHTHLVLGNSIAYVVGIFGSIAVTYWAYAVLPMEVIAYGLGLLAIITTVCATPLSSCGKTLLGNLSLPNLDHVPVQIPVFFPPETVGLDLSVLDEPRADFSVSCNTRRIDCCGED